MWFDTIIIDKISLDGTLQTNHIRPHYDRIPVEKLEKIDTTFHVGNNLDIGPLRIYEIHETEITSLTTKIHNFKLNIEEEKLYLQFDHFNIPVTAGYYSCVFPRGWRLLEVNIYDPYSNEENPANNRRYRDVLFSWDENSEFSSAQFEMVSRRKIFSLGVIAILAPASSRQNFIEERRDLSIIFTDSRHNNDPFKENYQKSADKVIETIQNTDKDKNKIPALNVNIFGMSFDITEWGKFIYEKIRRP